jgi:hypothetical protein
VPTPPLSLFRILDRLLEAEGTVSVRELLDEAREQTYGLALLILALLTFIPGVANLLSLGTLILGLQLWWGRSHLWLPEVIQRHEMQRGHVKALLAQVEARLAWLGTRTTPRRAPGRRSLGFLVTWTAFLAALPIPLPLANVLPATGLVLLGVSLLEEWPLLAWLGAGFSLLATVYFALSGGLLWEGLKAAIHAVMKVSA